MIRWEDAWRRATETNHPLIRGKKKGDFRSIDYVQTFANVPPQTNSGPLLQTFPAGAFVLGIEASAIMPVVTKADQYYADGGTAPLDSTFDRQPTATPGNLDKFSLSFQYTNDEIITPGGPGLAAALMGIDGGRFPTRELIIDPSQGILCTARNELLFQIINGTASNPAITISLTIHVIYKSMVPRAIG